MDYRSKQLEQELFALNKVFAELGLRLSEVAREMAAPGVMPSEKLLEQISASRTSFETVRSAVHSHAGTMLVSPLPRLGDLASLAMIDSLLKAAALAEATKITIEDEHQQALGILDRALSITHRESGDYKPLMECHAKIAELRNAVASVRWPHRHPESESIAGLKHPATALLNFVENLDRLDDERWMALETTITETYGKPLFVAASRGKLAVGPDSKSANGRPTGAAQAKTPPAPSPVAAGERPVEKKIVVEKTPQRPAPPPVAPTPVVAPAQMAPPVTPERRQSPPVVPIASAPVTPSTAAPVTPTPVASGSAGSAAALMTSAPVVAPPMAQQPQPQAPAPMAATPSAPVAVAAVPPAPVAAAPMPVVSAPAPSNAVPPAGPPPASVHSLSNLANATEAPEKRPAAPPADAADRQRKEARLATPGAPTLSKPEPKPQEGPETAQQGIAGDGSQRPQRWGFWRGNR